MAFYMKAIPILLAVVFCVNKLFNYIRVARFKKQHGCKPEVRIPQSERIIGYGLYKIQKKASQDRTILAVGKKRFEDNGITWSATLMGRVCFPLFPAIPNLTDTLQSRSIILLIPRM